LNKHLHHLSRTVQVRSKLLGAEASKGAYSEVLDTLALGIFTLSPSRAIVSLNAAAERILRRGDCLTIRNGRLAALDAGVETALSEALARASSSSNPHGSGFSLRRPSGEPYFVSVISASSGAAGKRQLLLLVTDPETEDAGLRARLQSSFALTDTEAKIAVLLAKRRTLAEIAAIRRSGVATIRAQVKSLTAKLGCSRQSEVVAIVKSFPSLASAE
jgi:DNA-binding CsgD family transcriptional regulator